LSFTHLHVHTEYSLLDGSNKIKEYVARVKELGMNSAAITDHGVMYGVIDFYREAKAAGINPILGCEVYVAPGSRFDREAGSGDDRYYHLVLLAENNTGYSNLTKIVSKGFTEGFYYKPRVDMEVLEKYHEGIIACLRVWQEKSKNIWCVVCTKKQCVPPDATKEFSEGATFSWSFRIMASRNRKQSIHSSFG
jgi:DNA polymerase III alpha subunit